jgi:hypothetical protein
MDQDLADDRIAVLVLALHRIIYPRRKKKSGRAFVDLVSTFIDSETRRRLRDGCDPIAMQTVIAAAMRCAEAVRDCRRIEEQRPRRPAAGATESAAH